jgi:molecular chaperone GrpE (heat shock protein)
MDNYEINILRRNGNWNKITQDDGVMNNNEQIENKNDHTQLDDDFKFYLNEVSSIIKKIEDLEKEKENLKDQLKIYEQEFINKKKDTEDKINLLTEEREILNKTINVMKNLRSI